MEHGAIIGRVEGALAACVESSPVPSVLREAMVYALLGGGKRLRPVLAWRCAEAVGGEEAGQRSLPAGVAIEMIHAFSLVHDDLPALDNDDLRRGRPTLHRHAGEAMAVLAGDALLTLAFDAADQLAGEGGADHALRLALVRELARSARSMIAGQVYDTLGGLPEGLDDAGRLELIHRNKTGALIRCACRMGAMLGAGSADDTEALRAVTRFAECLGLAFQIVDDLLDVEGSSGSLGKATGKDARAGKLTYPGVLGVEGARAEIARLEADAEEALRPLGPGAARLIELSRSMARRDR